MFRIIFILSLLISSQAWAEQTPTQVYDNTFANLTYPSVAGDFLVYSQRVGNKHQIMRVQAKHLYATSLDASAKLEHEVFKNGVALANGTFAYTSNSLGHITPWLAQKTRQKAINPGMFTASLLPNNLTVSNDGTTWVFDSTLESARTPRITKNFINEKLPLELLGQNWRMYHERLWEKKSGYPDTQSGMTNAFIQPRLFMFKQGSPDITMLGDGFDASLSADASWMVFVRENNGNFDLWRQNIDGTGLKRLTRSTFADVEPALNPAGTYVAFVSNRDVGGDVLQTSIYTLEIATGKVTRQTYGYDITDGGPAWLNDNTIIFHSNRDPKAPNSNTVENWRLWTIHVTK